MKFVRMFGDHIFYEWDMDNMRLHNFKGGWRTIDENSDEWMNAWVIDTDSWHDLYLKCGYCPLYVDIYERDAWMDPNGNLYEGTGHSYCAEKIAELLFGYDEWVDKYNPADKLINECGWVKITSSAMLPYYIKDGMYNNLTYHQIQVFTEWAKIHNKYDLLLKEGVFYEL